MAVSTTRTRRTITPRYLGYINDLLMEPFQHRRERQPESLYANIACLVDVLIHYRIKERTAVTYPPTAGQLKGCARQIFAFWDQANVVDWSNHVDTSSMLVGVLELLPVRDTRIGFLDSHAMRDLYITVMYTAALLHSTRGAYLPLCRQLVNCLRVTVTDAILHMELDPRWEARFPAQRMSYSTTPSPEVGRIYERYFGFYPSEVEPTASVSLAFHLRNLEVARRGETPPEPEGVVGSSR